MFNWVLNGPVVLADKHSIYLILKLFKVEKNSSTRELEMNWLTNKKVKKMLSVDLSYFLLQ